MIPVEAEEETALVPDNGVPLPRLFVPRRRAVRVYAAGRPVEELDEDGVLDGEVLPGSRLAMGEDY